MLDTSFRRTWHFLILVFVYILIFIASINQEQQIVTVSNLTPALFNLLRNQYGLTLSCGCTTVSTSYEAFVSPTVSLHPVCSSSTLLVENGWRGSISLWQVCFPQRIFALRHFRTWVVRFQKHCTWRVNVVVLFLVRIIVCSLFDYKWDHFSLIIRHSLLPFGFCSAPLRDRCPSWSRSNYRSCSQQHIDWSHLNH